MSDPDPDELELALSLYICEHSMDGMNGEEVEMGTAS